MLYFTVFWHLWFLVRSSNCHFWCHFPLAFKIFSLSLVSATWLWNSVLERVNSAGLGCLNTAHAKERSVFRTGPWLAPVKWTLRPWSVLADPCFCTSQSLGHAVLLRPGKCTLTIWFTANTYFCCGRLRSVTWALHAILGTEDWDSLVGNTLYMLSHIIDRIKDILCVTPPDTWKLVSPGLYPMCLSPLPVIMCPFTVINC